MKVRVWPHKGPAPSSRESGCHQGHELFIVTGGRPAYPQSLKVVELIAYLVCSSESIRKVEP